MSSPLFVNDIETLRAKLRLSGLASASDAEQVLQDAVLSARSRLYQRLGADRVTALLAIAYTETPTDQNGALRAMANTCEVKMVRRELMLSLPMLFSGGLGAAGESWSAEAPFRDVGVSDVKELTRLLETDIENALTALAADDAFPTEESSVRATTIGALGGSGPTLASGVFGGGY